MNNYQFDHYYSHNDINSDYAPMVLLKINRNIVFKDLKRRFYITYTRFKIQLFPA
jgi:hypothetical protein